MTSLDFTQLPLHDATLVRIEVDWASSTVSLLLALNAAVAPEGGAHRLTFLDFTQLVVPRVLPWGRTSQLNTAHRDASGFALEMQSGDVISVVAGDFVLERCSDR